MRGFCICCLALGSVLAQDFEILSLGTFSANNVSLTFEQYRPIRQVFLDRFKTDGIQGDVKLRIFETEAELVTQLAQGKIHFAPLTPIGYMEAKRRMPDLGLVGGEIREGSMTKKGSVVAMKSVSVFKIQDIKGRKVGLGSPGDPFYDIALRAFLVDQGINLKEVEFLRFENFRKIPEMLEVGRCQLTVLPDSVVKANPENYRVFGSVEVPNRVWVARGDLFPYQQDWIRQELTHLTPVQLQAIEIQGIETTTDAIFQPFIGYLRSLGYL
ncbi:MAG: PhnD/SsuA/transferrin family substrate-binding protein [Acidobacteria bacterium]|nr:PhnD/SsuA/transferrin family substrate-binding protein [Acidobacteriota bacterium]MCB9398300.1 PhnD/SsuA/transferrin family substrate-binding protein [Acidobacteriota bacterium]